MKRPTTFDKAFRILSDPPLKPPRCHAFRVIPVDYTTNDTEWKETIELWTRRLAALPPCHVVNLGDANKMTLVSREARFVLRHFREEFVVHAEAFHRVTT